MNIPQIKLPPKPQGPGTNNNINYKLPPRPVYGGGSNNAINRSYEQEKFKKHWSTNCARKITNN